MALVSRSGGGRGAAGLWAAVAARGQVYARAVPVVARRPADRRPDPTAHDFGRGGPVFEEYEPVYRHPGGLADDGSRDPGEGTRYGGDDAFQTAATLGIPGRQVRRAQSDLRRQLGAGPCR